MSGSYELQQIGNTDSSRSKFQPIRELRFTPHPDGEQSDAGYESERNGHSSLSTDVDLSDSASSKQEKASQGDAGAEEDSERYSLFWRVHLLSALAVVLFMCSAVMISPLQSQYVYFRLGLVYFNSTDRTPGQSVPCDDNASSENEALQQRVQAETSQTVMYLGWASSIPTIVINFFLGSYSDHLGRKLLFILPVVGNALCSLIFVLVTALELNLNFLYLGKAFDGCGGGVLTMLLGVYTVNADVTPPESKRTIAITVIETLQGLAVAVSMLVSGILIQKLGYVYPSVLMLILVVLSGVVSIGFIPATAPPQKERTRLSPLVHVRAVLSFFLDGRGRRRLQYVLIMLVLMLYILTFFGRSGITTLYQLNRPFCWDAALIGYYGAGTRVLQVLVSLTVVVLLQRCLRLEYQAVLSFLSLTGALVLEGLAYNDLMLYLMGVTSMFASLAAPVLRSLSSRLTPPGKQGAMFSGVAVVEGICLVLSSAIYNPVYAATLSVFRGLVFLIMAGVCTLSIVLMLCFRLVSGREEITYKTETVEVKPPPTKEKDTQSSSSTPTKKPVV